MQLFHLYHRNYFFVFPVVNKKIIPRITIAHPRNKQIVLIGSMHIAVEAIRLITN